MRLTLLLPLVALAASCHAAPRDTQPSPTAAPSAVPPMPTGSVGPVEDLWGIWESRFEVSNFAICSDSTCNRTAADACWLDGTKEFFDAINESGIRSFEPDSPRYRVHLQGRVERGAYYGHMGANRCQIDGEKLLGIERWRSL